tara:strand:- start:1011 stop:1994 length:984 start_codon:yes stop_codon:yes gene_type:complete
VRIKNYTFLTTIAFFLSLLGLIGPGFWNIKSPNLIKFNNNIFTRASVDIRFNPNELKLDNKFNNSKLTSKKFFGKEIAIAWSQNFLDQIKINNKVSRVFFTQLPSDLNSYKVENKKKIFVSIMLPLLLKGSELVYNERINVINYLNSKNFDKLSEFCVKYRVKKIKCENLSLIQRQKFEAFKRIILNRVNTFPVSMMLAQAIVESGWGVSRFAQQGNALFGQWTWNKKKGISPKGRYNPDFAVMSFKNLQDSVNAYILNLNTHPAYTKMRNYRKIINDPKKFKGKKFSKYLDKYAEIGFKYVKKINVMIDKNNLEKYNLIILNEEKL